jgi:rubrerythrin
MKEQPEMGVNRTGIQMSPIDAGELKADVDSLMPVTSGDDSAIADVRSAYILEADKIGSIPMPGTVKGAVSTGVSMLTGNSPQLLLDKLGERLAFERSGTRLYDALITKVTALQQNGVSTLPLDRLAQIRNEEAAHFAMVADAIRGLGGDPTSQTPCADLVGVESMGLMQAVTDPRTTVAQSLHAILVAEMTDNNGWEMLIALAEEQNHDAMAADFTTALQHERDHLQQVQTWFEEATLGTPMSGRSRTAAGAGTSPLH